MMKRLLLLHTLLVLSYATFCQGVGIGTSNPDVSAALDITSVNKGLLVPRMNLNAINAIVNPARGLLVYDSVVNQFMVNIGSSAAPNWQPVTAGNGGAAWNLVGNSGTNPANQFIGTTDNQPLRFRINNVQVGELHPVTGNIFWGLRAGQANATGFSNIAIGMDALISNKDGFGLVALGDSALFHNDIGNPAPGIFAAFNTAIGHKALFSNTFGSNNTATGTRALSSNSQGNLNSAFGASSLLSNIGGGFNTAIGGQSMANNTIGNFYYA